jgi:hypothetical protein
LKRSFLVETNPNDFRRGHSLPVIAESHIQPLSHPADNKEAQAPSLRARIAVRVGPHSPPAAGFGGRDLGYKGSWSATSSEARRRTPFALQEHSNPFALLKAEELLAPYGKTVVEAAEFYVERHEQIKNSRLLDDAVPAFLQELKADGLSARYQKDCKNRLTRFRKSFGERLVAEISSNEVGDWLRSLKDEDDNPLAAFTLCIVVPAEEPS